MTRRAGFATAPCGRTRGCSDGRARVAILSFILEGDQECQLIDLLHEVLLLEEVPQVDEVHLDHEFHDGLHVARLVLLDFGAHVLQHELSLCA